MHRLEDRLVVVRDGVLVLRRLQEVAVETGVLKSWMAEAMMVASRSSGVMRSEMSLVRQKKLVFRTTSSACSELWYGFSGTYPSWILRKKVSSRCLDRRNLEMRP